MYLTLYQALINADDAVSVKTINQAIRAVANFKKAVAISPSQELNVALQSFEEDLQRFIPEDTPKQKSRARRVSDPQGGVSLFSGVRASLTVNSQ